MTAPILIVDNDAAKRLALKAVLSPLGYSISEADSGTAALRCVLEQDFAVVLLDVQMPIMNGFETAAAIRERRESEMTPIIFITAHSSDEMPDTDLWAQGAVDFIFAPVPANELRAKVSVFANLFLRAQELAAQAREVQASVDQLRVLTDAAPIGIFETDADRKYVYANPRWTELTGVSAAEAVGLTCEGILDSVDDGRITERPDLTASSERSHRYEIDRPGLAPRIVLVTAKPISDGDGGVAGWVGTLADVTAATREAGANLARRVAEGRYRHIVETTMEGIWLIDAENRTTFANEAMARMVGTTVDDFLRKSMWDLIDPATHGDAAERIDSLRSGLSERFESRLVGADGAMIPVLVSVNPIFDESGAFGGALSMVRDETERVEQEEHRQQLEEQLRHSQRLESIGALAGGIAHDFNNLLLVICGYGELALKRIERGEQVKRSDIKDMLEAGERATQLTRQLLAFGRRQVLAPEVVDLRDVLGDNERLLGKLVGDAVELETSAPDEPVLVEVDRTQLEQVLANLATNARDAMPNGGRLGIELSRAGDENEEVVLAVSDNGSGMDAETAARVFEPFFSTKGAAGSGFGLSTVHGIVSQSGGRIALESRPGVGSTFSIYLPLSEAAVTPAPSALAEAEGGADTILVVEDDPSVRTIVAAMLADLGYRVLEADGGDEAVELASAHGSAIDLVLTDLVMPGSSGRETAERVRELIPAAKVLYMSGYTDDVVIRDGGHFEPGVAFIQKPFGARELSRSVRDVLEVELV
jgi:two-component system, cell cycle sensor histidine kinase and response regulator CckA